jgi:CRP/FNR family transcriptional regulator
VSGGLKLFKGLRDGRAQITGYLLPGDFLGLPPRGTYTFSAEALEKTELCRFPRVALKRVFDKYEKLQDRFLTVVHDDLIAAQEHMLLLGRKTAMERLCTFLVRLLHRTERVGGVTAPLRLPLHRTDIADYLGLTVETVSRTFSQLRKSELIRLEKADRVFVLDRARLEAIADGT